MKKRYNYFKTKGMLHYYINGENNMWY